MRSLRFRAVAPGAGRKASTEYQTGWGFLVAQANVSPATPLPQISLKAPRYTGPPPHQRLTLSLDSMERSALAPH